MARLASSTLLAEGALRALEHALALVDDAFALFELQRWSSAAVLSVFAREELGRYAILGQQARRIAGGAQVTVAKVRALCADHEDKLRRGFTGTTVQLSPEDSAAFVTAMDQPTSPAFMRLRERLDRAHA